MNEAGPVTDRALVRARWFAGVAGGLIAAAVPVLLVSAGLVAQIIGWRVSKLLYGKPLPALTEWFVGHAGHLLGDLRGGPLHWGVLVGFFLLVYLPLLIAVYRAGNIAVMSLIFSVWFALLLSVELLMAGVMAAALLLPFVTVVVSLKS